MDKRLKLIPLDYKGCSSSDICKLNTSPHPLAEISSAYQNFHYQSSQDVHPSVNTSTATFNPSLANRIYGHPSEHMNNSHNDAVRDDSGSFELAAHYGIPQSLPAPPRATARSSFSPPAFDFDTMKQNYLAMLSSTPSGESSTSPNDTSSMPTAPPNDSDLSFIELVNASPEFPAGHCFGQYLTSPLSTPYAVEFDDFSSPVDDSPYLSDLNTPVMDQLDEFDQNNIVLDPNSGWSTTPLFNDSSMAYYQAVQPELSTKETQQPSKSEILNSDKLYAFSPSTPALEDFHSPLTQPIHSPVMRPAQSLYPSPRAPMSGSSKPNTPATNRSRSKSRAASGTATGTRRDITPATMVPLDAPTQTRNYIIPSSTSRKANPLHAQKRSHSQAFGQGQEQDELTEEAPPGPNATEREHIEWKRRQNTIAARKSRRRKLEYMQSLEAENDELREDRDKWRTRCGVMEGVLKANGMVVPEWED